MREKQVDRCEKGRFELVEFIKTAQGTHGTTVLTVTVVALATVCDRTVVTGTVTCAHAVVSPRSLCQYKQERSDAQRK